jgi:beta-phosphoglucomutase family hydrolase
MEALIFDCDGTLADTMPAHYRAWQQVLASTSLVFPEARFYALAGVPTPRIAALLVSESGLPLDPAQLAEDKERTYRQSVSTVTAIEKVVAIARAARGRLPLAVASGSHRALVESTLAAIGTLDWWQAIVAAEDVTHPKPAPDVFLEAARRLGVPPDACTVYEDADLGLEAARRAGMKAVDIRRLP